MSWRSVLATTVDSVPGLTGYTVPPAVLSPGDSWPSWVSAEPSGTYDGPAQTWHVMVILPNGTAADTIDAEDALVDQVMAALTNIAEVVIVEPVTVAVTDPAAGDPVPAIRFTVSTTGGSP